MSEVAVAQVEPKLFKRASRFDEWMSVSVSAVDHVLEVDILDDVVRMAQWCLKLKALHREQLSESARHGFE